MNGPNIAKSERDEVRLFLDQATEHALIILDRGGIIVQWLAGAQTVFGYSADEVIGQRHSRLFTPEDVEAGAPEMELAIADAGTPAEDDRWMLRKDGLRFWATGILQAIRAADGAVIGYGKVLRNRTDLKGQLESLENEVRKLNRADERKNRFISTLSHELRNPLSSLVTAVELLDVSSSAPEDDANFALAIIKRQVDAMRRLVDDLLDITRVSAGKVKLELREEPLIEIVKTAADACRPLLAERTHNFHLILGDQPVIVKADAARLEQVFVNLIQNAAKYTEHGGTIWVKLIVEGQEAVVKVEDTGIGISADLLPQIFDLFTQAEFAAGAATEGLGIGLSVVRDLAQLHGGTVTVRSDGVGKGSEFNVRLPLAGPDSLRADSPTSVR